MLVRKNNIIYNLDHYAKVYPNPDRCALCLADVQGDYDTIDFEDVDQMNFAFSLITRYLINNSNETLPEMVCLDVISWGDSVNSNIDRDATTQHVLNAYHDMMDEHHRRDIERQYQEALQENEEIGEAENPWNEGQPLGNLEEQWNEQHGEMPAEQPADPDEFAQEPGDWPVEEDVEEEEEDIHQVHMAMDGNVDPHVEFAPEMIDAIHNALQDRFDDQAGINNQLQNQIFENNQFVEEQVDRLERQNAGLEAQVAYLRQQINRIVEQDLHLELEG